MCRFVAKICEQRRLREFQSRKGSVRLQRLLIYITSEEIRLAMFGSFADAKIYRQRHLGG